MKRQLVKTTDGSHTLYVPELNEHYHSKFGAVTESRHIFIDNGLKHICDNNVSILEIGFGTGLNALLTLEYAIEKGIHVYYESIEKYPITQKESELLNFTSLLSPELKEYYVAMHSGLWDKEIEINSNFNLFKRKTDLKNFIPDKEFDIIYFDAFAPEIQPGLWTTSIFLNLYHALKTNGILVTYSVKGCVKQNLRDAGFKVEKFKGPPGGKRENLRALKI